MVQQLNRRLREEQDAEYQRSLLADQEREKQRVAERAAQEEQQQAAQQAQDAERQESYSNCPVECCLQCLHRSACACSTKSEHVCCCNTQVCLCAFGASGVDLHLLKAISPSVPYSAEGIVLSNMAAMAHAEKLAGSKLIMSSFNCLIWDCHMLHPSSKSFSTKVAMQDCRF